MLLGVPGEREGAWSWLSEALFWVGIRAGVLFPPRGGRKGWWAGHWEAPCSPAHAPLCLLQAKSSEEMGHWLGLLLSESGSKTDPEEFTYDYVDADRVSCIVSAAKNSLL